MWTQLAYRKCFPTSFMLIAVLCMFCPWKHLCAFIFFWSWCLSYICGYCHKIMQICSVKVLVWYCSKMLKEIHGMKKIDKIILLIWRRSHFFKKNIDLIFSLKADGPNSNTVFSKCYFVLFYFNRNAPFSVIHILYFASKCHVFQVLSSVPYM